MGSGPTPVILLTFLYKYCFRCFEHLHKVSSTIIHAIEHTIYRQDSRVVRGTGSTHQSLQCPGFETHSFHYVDILYQVLFSLFWNLAHGIFYHYSYCWLQNIQAGWPSGKRRWFKAPLISVVSRPTPVILLTFLYKYCFLYFEHLYMVSPTFIHTMHHTAYRQDCLVV